MIAIVGILIALLLPAIQAARESCAPRRLQKQSQANRAGRAELPCGEGASSAAKAWRGQFNPLGGTFIALLPYLEENARFDAYDPTKPVDDPNQLADHQPPGRHLSLPVDDLAARGARSRIRRKAWPRQLHHLLAHRLRELRRSWTARSKILARRQLPLGLQHITDGTSKTLLVGEINYGRAVDALDQLPRA